MTFQSMFEEILVAQGFDAMVQDHKNKLSQVLAERFHMSFWEVTPAFILSHHKKLKIQVMDEACVTAITQGFTSVNGHKYRLNDDDQTNFLGQKDRLRDKPEIDTVAWRTEDSGYAQHTRADWLVVQAEAFDHKLTQLMKYDQYCTKIKKRYY
ncbi:hypothetical protein Thu_105 [Bacillus phage Thurquoise]|nr:hypothetical protein Thu_105 [Bacillus phage Thurquoise]